jgi:hypothetical protein
MTYLSHHVDQCRICGTSMTAYFLFLLPFLRGFCPVTRWIHPKYLRSDYLHSCSLIAVLGPMFRSIVTSFGHSTAPFRYHIVRVLIVVELAAFNTHPAVSVRCSEGFLLRALYCRADSVDPSSFNFLYAHYSFSIVISHLPTPSLDLLLVFDDPFTVLWRHVSPLALMLSFDAIAAKIPAQFAYVWLWQWEPLSTWLL